MTKLIPSDASVDCNSAPAWHSAPVTTRRQSSLYDLLKSIQPEHLSENAWAAHAKVNRSWFYDIRRGAVPRTDTLEKIVGVAGLNLAQFYDLEGAHEAAPPSVEFIRQLPFRRPTEALDIPLFGTAQGSDMEILSDDRIVFVERMDLNMMGEVEYLRRPEALLGRDDVYAITVVGNSVAPRYDDGDPAYISSKQKPRYGDYVVVQLKRRDEDGEEALHIAVLKQLVRRTSSYLELAQSNPPITFTVALSDVHAVHRVIPWREIVFF